MRPPPVTFHLGGGVRWVVSFRARTRRGAVEPWRWRANAVAFHRVLPGGRRTLAAVGVLRDGAVVDIERVADHRMPPAPVVEALRREMAGWR
jgi:hypothetical protein